MYSWEYPFMRTSSRLLTEVMQILRSHIQPGVTTLELDSLAEQEIRAREAVPAFKGYGSPPFPATVCASKNEAIVHGVPDEVPLVEGDLLSLDLGLVYRGYFADMAVTVFLGEPPPATKQLIDITQEALESMIEAARPGTPVGVLGGRVEALARANGLGIAEGFYGHGIGRALHGHPAIPNRKELGGPLLQEGMAICIEPMLTLGTGRVQVLDDGWTAVTADGSLAAHFEHTLLITGSRTEVLTRPAR